MDEEQEVIEEAREKLKKQLMEMYYVGYFKAIEDLKMLINKTFDIAYSEIEAEMKNMLED